jgi:uncharacterized protein (DUF427 family)
MSSGHKITISPADQHVEISVSGVKLAESDRAVLLQETGIRRRYYLPREDVRMEYLRPTVTKTTCPFKGEASYWSVDLDGDAHEDLVWSYEAPIPAAAGIAGLLCFYAERVDEQVS